MASKLKRRVIATTNLPKNVFFTYEQTTALLYSLGFPKEYNNFAFATVSSIALLFKHIQGSRDTIQEQLGISYKEYGTFLEMRSPYPQSFKFEIVNEKVFIFAKLKYGLNTTT